MHDINLNTIQQLFGPPSPTRQTYWSNNPADYTCMSSSTLLPAVGLQ